MIQLDTLPQEIRDRLTLKEQSEPTFENALVEDYTEIMFKTLKERRNPMVQHSYIATIYGQQGGGKCIDKDEYMFIKDNDKNWKLSKIDNIKVGDVVWVNGYNNKPQLSNVLNVWRKIERGYVVRTKRSSDFICSGNHLHIIKRNNKITEVKTKDLVDGDVFLNYRYSGMNNVDIKSRSYSLGFVTGSYLADGCIQYFKGYHKSSVIITKGEGRVLDLIQYHCKKSFGVSFNFYTTKGKSAKTLKSHDMLLIKYFENFNTGKDKFFVPYQYNYSFLKGLLDGYVNCDSTINTKGSNTDMGLLTYSKEMALALQTTISMFNFCSTYYIRILRSGKYIGREYHGLRFGRSEGQRFFSFVRLLGDKKKVLNKIKMIPELKTNADLINVFENYFENPLVEVIDTKKDFDMVDIETGYGNFFLANNILTHNSYAGLTKCAVLDRRFSVDKIYFDVELLVNDRKNLKPNTSVLVDEMTRVYGTDSVRISIMINAIKEQLRKKSIHMIYSSPTLKEEYKTSMYVMEAMFIDMKEKLAYFAYKTNELLTLGYVVIPHPLNFVDRNLLLAYEEKKDIHLSSLLEGGVDAIQDRAEMVMKNELFMKADKMYKEARGYIPYKILVQLVEKIFPEFKGSVIVYELADRVKADKEISGDWLIFGSKKSGE